MSQPDADDDHVKCDGDDGRDLAVRSKISMERLPLASETRQLTMSKMTN